MAWIDTSRQGGVWQVGRGPVGQGSGWCGWAGQARHGATGYGMAALGTAGNGVAGETGMRPEWIGEAGQVWSDEVRLGAGRESCGLAGKARRDMDGRRMDWKGAAGLVKAGKDMKNRNHLQRVAELPCTVCNTQPVQVHHARTPELSGAGRRASDWYTIPLCLVCHTRLHANKKAWEMAHGKQVDLIPQTLQRLYG